MSNDAVHEFKNDSRCFFFFQAEDGIRDGHVTGVQTCALPISDGAQRGVRAALRGAAACAQFVLGAGGHGRVRRSRRSEERRVGKECRYWWSRTYYKQKYEENSIGTYRRDRHRQQTEAREEHA